MGLAPCGSRGGPPPDRLAAGDARRAEARGEPPPGGLRRLGGGGEFAGRFRGALAARHAELAEGGGRARGGQVSQPHRGRRAEHLRRQRQARGAGPRHLVGGQGRAGGSQLGQGAAPPLPPAHVRPRLRRESPRRLHVGVHLQQVGVCEREACEDRASLGAARTSNTLADGLGPLRFARRSAARSSRSGRRSSCRGKRRASAGRSSPPWRRRGICGALSRSACSSTRGAC
mmetsp:Transcript_78093/g.218923  ORF Transcript_78093/g.218923 Transcript_78093/m.218923 type:complete len:230 (+) Transcript_78093:268-957(+)